MKKRKPILVYLTSDELQHITESAKNVGMDRSAYIRHRCLHENPNVYLTNPAFDKQMTPQPRNA